MSREYGPLYIGSTSGIVVGAAVIILVALTFVYVWYADAHENQSNNTPTKLTEPNIVY